MRSEDRDFHKKAYIEKEFHKPAKHFIETQPSNFGVWKYNVTEDKLDLSDQVFKILSIGRQENMSLNEMVAYIDKVDQIYFHKAVQKSIEQGINTSLEVRLNVSSETTYTVALEIQVVKNEKGRTEDLIGTVVDISKQKQLEHRLQKQEAQLCNIYQNLDVGIWSVDLKENKVLFCSKRVEDIFKTSASNFLQYPFEENEFIHSDDIYEVKVKRQSLLRGEEFQHQFRITSQEGELKWVEEKIIPIIEDGNQVTRLDGFIYDITSQKEKEDLKDKLTYQDYLTKLPNHRYFEERLEECIQNPGESMDQPFAVLHLDLDRFKYINNMLGRQKGDTLIKHISDLLDQSAAKNMFISRTSGDEFLLLLKNLHDYGEGIDIANSIIKLFEKPIYIDDYELFVTASLGISFYPKNGSDAEKLLKNAETALFKAKESGKNNLKVYTPAMDVETYKTNILENDLRRALKANEFYIEYQPMMDPETGRVKKAEALLRWEHPEWGRVSPGKFIPIAEEAGLIYEMDDWVFRQVCLQLKKWEELGYTVVPISLNVSPKRLLRSGLLQYIRQTIKETNVTPALIEIELTERMIIESEDWTKNIILQLRKMGIKVSLDDFGTGYSSLSILKDFMIDTVKIDRSFISKITQDKKSESIVKSLIILSRELEIELVAEGVETHEQLSFLQKRGCTAIQGFIYSPAVGGEVFQEFLQKKVLHPVI